MSQLAIALTEKWKLSREARLKVESLELEVQRRTERLREMTLTDALTGLANRTQLMLRLRDAIEAAAGAAHQPFTVFFLDFDRFKIINDSFGHHCGDMLLNAIADRLRGFMIEERSVIPDAAAARIGGDEFVMFLPGLSDPAQTTRVGQRLLQRLRAPYPLRDIEVYSTASVGVTSSEFQYTAAEEVLRDADTAMYAAKLQGKDCLAFFDRSMHEQSVHRLALEADLRKAVDRRELLEHYQAIINLTSGRVSGFEVLLRWQHPERGAVSPADFVPIAEETGLIVPIGCRTLHRALAQLRAWQDLYRPDPPLYIAVNVSKRQLMDATFVATVRDALNRHHVDPHLLYIEVTESVIMDRAEAMTPILKELRSLGVKLCMDDFGVGHSSLSCLQHFPINVLKIDRSFIAHLSNNREYAAVVQAIIALAGNLNMSVTAEGLELPEQLAQVLALDCNEAQGWLFARAMPADQCRALLERDCPMTVPPQAA